MFLQHQLACPLGQQVNDAGVEVAFPSMSMLCAQVTATQCKPITAAEGSWLQVDMVLDTVPTPWALLGTNCPHALSLCMLSFSQ